MTFSRRLMMFAVFAAATAFAPHSVAQDAPSGPILLTVTGAVSNTNRGGYDPDTDKLFGFNEVEFANAAQFDYNALEALDMIKVKADFPKGRQVHEFEGPLLADVLKAAGAKGKTVTIQALDGYAVEMSLADAVDAGAVVALKRDGTAFGIGDFGPTQIVFPRAERADLAEMTDDNWVWSIFHIKVE